jgi:lipopolysaccharide export system protein LptA
VAFASALVAWVTAVTGDSTRGGIFGGPRDARAQNVRAEAVFGVGGDALGVQADTLDLDFATSEATLTGNVQLSKGDLRVRCPRIDLRLEGGMHVRWARGSGGVSADVRGVHAEAPEFELDTSRHLLELRGGVRLSRGNGWIQAERASVDIHTAKVSLSQVKGSIPIPARSP